METNPLNNPDLLARVFLHLDDYLEIEMGMAFVSRAWRDGTRRPELGFAPAYRRAFWLRFATSDEDTLGEMEPAAPGTAMEGAGFDWRAECRYRWAAGVDAKGWAEAAPPRKVCEMPGEVIFAVAPTLPSDLFICGSESGTIFFIDPDEQDESKAIVFSFQAHEAHVRAVQVVRTGHKPHSTYRVMSIDTVESLRVHYVEPVAKTVVRETNVILGDEPTQIAIIHEVKTSLAAIVGLANGTVMIAEGWEKGEDYLHLHDNKVVKTDMLYRSADAPVDQIRLIAPVPPGDNGVVIEPQHTLAVTATNNTPARTCYFLVQRRSSPFASEPSNDPAVPLGLREHLDLDVSGHYFEAGVSNTRIALARDSTLVLGYGDGTVLSERDLPKYDKEGLHVRHPPVVLTKSHTDEVWDIAIGGDVIFTTSRDRHLAARTKGGKELFRREVGWVVRTKPSPDRILLLGFDSVLRVLERKK